MRKCLAARSLLVACCKNLFMLCCVIRPPIFTVVIVEIPSKRVVVLLVGVVLGSSLALGTLGRGLIVVLIIVISILVVIILDHIKVVLESKGDELVLEFVGKFEVLIHEFSDVLLGLSLLIVFLLLGRFTSGKFIFIGHHSGLEEIEETLLLNSLSDGLTWLTLLGLLLLFDLLLCHILAIFPVDFSSLALLDHILILAHHE
jgi:hypothetical protein